MTLATKWKKQNRNTLDCIECERTVTRSRKDQKFCSDGCRYAYNRRNSYRAQTVRMSFAKWRSFIDRDDSKKELTKTEFMAAVRDQLRKIPEWN